jgi:hypothetical protein
MDDKTDPSRTFQMRVRKSFMDKIDQWRRQQDDLPPQAEAIRRLVEKGLEADRAESKKRR